MFLNCNNNIASYILYLGESFTLNKFFKILLNDFHISNEWLLGTMENIKNYT